MILECALIEESRFSFSVQKYRPGTGLVSQSDKLNNIVGHRFDYEERTVSHVI